MSLRILSPNHRLQPLNPTTADDLHVSERRWFAVRTSAKHEKRATRELARAGVEYFLPLRERTYTYASKKVTRQLPLLSGYVFVRLLREEERAVYGNPYVRSFVRLGRERRRVTEAEIELLRRLSTDRELDWETIEDTFSFSSGTPVEIISGPLAGVKGHYVRKKSKKTFIVALGSLNACLATCEVDPRCLMPLNGAPRQSLLDPAEDDRTPLW